MEITVKRSIDFTRIFDIIEYQTEKYANPTALNTFSDGKWQGLSILEIKNKVDAISCWFIQNEFSKGEKIIFMPIMGSQDWMILDYACQQVGLIVVPIHPTLRPEEMETVLAETEAGLFITADAQLYEKFNPLLKKSGRIIQLHHIDPQLAEYFTPLYLTKADEGELKILHEIKKGIDTDDVFTILYTSGSSGIPKGVQLTHRNVIHNIKAILTLLPLEPSHRVLSFLPFSHVFERVACYTYMAFGVSLYFSQTKESFGHDFKTAKPYFCTCVPRVLEKMYDFMEEQLLTKNVLKRELIKWAMAVGKNYGIKSQNRFLYTIKLFIARKVVLSQWRKMLGGNIRYMVVGAASLRPDIGRLFTASGIHVIEGYGMTETAPLITMNRYEPGLNRFGTVGLVIPGIEVKIDQPDGEQGGEILVKGPNVMKGYYKRPELTKEVFTEDGWFRTGDVGKFVQQRFLKITDRKKDIFKTSAGKYVAPLPLQNHFAQSAFIQRCLIIGFQRPYVTALLVPHFTMLEAWCLEQGIHWTSPPFMVHNIKVKAKLREEVEKLNEELPNFQRIKDFVMCHEEWTIENGEITNTLKPVRHLLVDHYKVEIEKMYA